MSPHRVANSASEAERRTGRALLAVVLGSGIAVALLIQLSATVFRKIAGYEFALIFIAGLAFSVLSYLARWLLTKNRKRTFLSGRFPLAIALIKLSAFITFALSLLLFLASLLIGGAFKTHSLDVLVRSAIYFAIITLFADGFLNSVMVIRHFRGTLAATSREVSRRRWLSR